MCQTRRHGNKMRYQKRNDASKIGDMTTSFVVTCKEEYTANILEFFDDVAIGIIKSLAQKGVQARLFLLRVCFYLVPTFSSFLMCFLRCNCTVQKNFCFSIPNLCTATAHCYSLCGVLMICFKNVLPFAMDF